MDCKEFENKCRICLKDNADIHWNNVLYDYSNLTYKDCYYKYTRLECFDEDYFSQMLCHSCSDGLEYVDTLISKALDTHLVLDTNRLSMVIKVEGDVLDHGTTEFDTILIEEIKLEKETLSINENFNKELPTITQNNETSQISKKSIKTLQKQKKQSVKSMKTTNKIEDLNNFEDVVLHTNRLNIKVDCDDLNHGTTEFETVLIEETKPEKDTLCINENFNKELTTKTQKKRTSQRSKKSMGRLQKQKKKSVKSKKTTNKIEDLNNFEDDFVNENNTAKDQKTEVLEDTSKQDDNKNTKKFKPILCSFCSKVSYDKYTAIKHEKIHSQNRERNETCDVCGLKFYSKCVLKSHMKTHSEVREKPHKCEHCDQDFYYKGDLTRHQRKHLGQKNETCEVCGLKFFNKRVLNSHMKIHLESREKSYKCEFCDKGFYHQSDLSRHRRKHSDSMISCSLCTKQFFSQAQLYKHMYSHSVARINSNTKQKTKFYLRCKDCGKIVYSESYKSHTAMHMNEPLYKCSICNKEFFHRNSCCRHLKIFHKKPKGGTSNFIISYKKNRTSLLDWQQKADIQVFTK